MSFKCPPSHTALSCHLNAWSTSIELCACTPVEMLCKPMSEVKGFLSLRYPRTALVSFQSRSCPVTDISLFCSPVLQFIPCNILHYFVDFCTSRHCHQPCQALLLCHTPSLVRPPVVFKVLISACSITRSVGRPAHKRLLLLTT